MKKEIMTLKEQSRLDRQARRYYCQQRKHLRKILRKAQWKSR